MTERRVKILNKTGLHIRPARLFVETANQFRSTVRVSAGDREADGRSILSLMLTFSRVPDCTRSSSLHAAAAKFAKSPPM